MDEINNFTVKAEVNSDDDEQIPFAYGGGDHGDYEIKDEQELLPDYYDEQEGVIAEDLPPPTPPPEEDKIPVVKLEVQGEGFNMMMVPACAKQQHVCEFCSATFPTTAALNNHISKHLDLFAPNFAEQAAVFECDLCFLKFATKRSLKSHKVLHDIDDRAASLACGGKPGVWNPNRVTKRRKGDRRVKCNECGVTYSSYESLKVHKARIHCDARPFRCDICDRTFKVQKDLTSHTKTKMHKEKLADLAAPKLETVVEALAYPKPKWYTLRTLSSSDMIQNLPLSVQSS